MNEVDGRLPAATCQARQDPAGQVNGGSYRLCNGYHGRTTLMRVAPAMFPVAAKWLVLRSDSN